MPYVITTIPAPGAFHDNGSPVFESRRAVATLEEARRHPEHEGWDSARCEDCGHFEAEHESGWCAGCDNGGRKEADICRTWRPSEVALMFKALPESGGTVGPLPDGTVIEVERVDWTELLGSVMAAANMGDTEADALSHEQIIDAYNARS